MCMLKKCMNGVLWGIIWQGNETLGYENGIAATPRKKGVKKRILLSECKNRNVYIINYT